MDTEILIVGAGPAGLTLANILAAAGADFMIVDRKAGPVEESRAAVVHVRTLELLDRLDLADRAIARGVKINRVEVHQRDGPAIRFPLAGQGAEALTPFPYALGLEQDRLEGLLLERLAEQGHHVRWETEVMDLSGTTAVLRSMDGGDETSVAARRVVGADGAHSVVRRALGMELTGKTYRQTGLLADVELDTPQQSSTGAIRLHLTRGGFVGMLPLGSGRRRLFGAVPPELAPRDTSGPVVSHEAYAHVSLEKLRRWFHDCFPVDTELKQAAWTALFRVHSRITDRFRVGDVFLVGDAAHIHSPAGGQGMNLGIGDAVNLGWKLALVATGRARQSLLDTYEPERLPIARTVLRGTDRAFALEATSNPAAQWVRAHVAPRLLRPVLKLRPVQERIFRLFSQTWISYRTSTSIKGDGPRPGDRAPYLDGRDHPPAGLRHELLLFAGPGPHADPDPEWLEDLRHAIADVLAGYAVPTAVHVITAAEIEAHEIYGARGPRMFLIRPDGHLSFAGSPYDLAALTADLDEHVPSLGDLV